MDALTLIVIAKAPVPGRAKTRLCPPCDPEQASALAEAALRDTLAAVGRAPAARRVLALEGSPGDWLPGGFDVVQQRGEGLGQRLAHAFDVAGGPAVLVGMDTPQLTTGMLADAGRALAGANTDAVLGPALDGGYWAIGLRRPDPSVFDGVPMSTPHTLRAQAGRLRALGLRHRRLAPLRDVDTIDDARAVAHAAPATAFAACLRSLL
jgi:rSAM/selenodomain-associated transferase 1